MARISRNLYLSDGDVTHIAISNAQGIHQEYAIIDTADVESAQSFGTWSISKKYSRDNKNIVALYVVCNHKDYLHRFLMSPPKGMEIDHINRNPLDNRRCNLRIVSPGQNKQNTVARKTSTSGVRNVYWCSRIQRWTVQITIAGKRISHGTHHTIEEASAAAAQLRRKYHSHAPADCAREFDNDDHSEEYEDERRNAIHAGECYEGAY
jgi:hypothetical protein